MTLRLSVGNAPFQTQGPLLTNELIGRAPLPTEAPVTHHELRHIHNYTGTGVDCGVDYLGERWPAKNVLAGPLSSLVNAKNEVVVWPKTSFPKPIASPGSLTAMPTDASVLIQWEPTTKGASQYIVEFKHQWYGSFAELARVPAGATSFLHKNLDSQTAWSYRVRAVVGNGLSPYTNTVNATTHSDKTLGDHFFRYRFENNGVEEKRNAPTSLAGTPTFDSARKEGSFSLNLDGVNDHVGIPEMALPSVFTVSTWVYFNGSGTNTILANSKYGDNQKGFKFQINTYPTNDRALTFVSSDGVQVKKATTGTGVVMVNGWNHVAAVVDSVNGVVRIYHNGVDKTVNDQLLSGFTKREKLRIGSLIDGARRFKGRLDDFRLYRRALSADEVKALATNGGM